MSIVPRFLAGPAVDELQIEPLRRRHLGAILPIEHAAYPAGWSRGVFQTELDQVRDGTRFYRVAKLGRAVVGYAGLWFVPDPGGDEAHVTNIVVAAEHHRSGIATRLMLALAEAAIERGCVAWTLEVRASAEGAQALYRRFGFAPAGVRARYYDNTEDAIVMWCHDIDRPEYRARLDDLACR